MTLSVLTNATFPASADGFTSGLVGTVGVRILDEGGATIVARSTAGITEPVAGLYAKTLTAPGVVGDYIIYWDNGGTGLGLQEASEDLIVGASVTSAIDLCTLNDVRAWLQKQGSETSQDAVIQQAITTCSRVIMEFCDREFAPMSSGTRRLAWDGHSQKLSLAPYDLRAASSVVLGPDTAAISLTEGIDYELRPVGGRELSAATYTDIAFGPLVYARAGSLQRLVYMGTALVDITGDWGFPSIPETVQQAAILTAGLWLRRDVSAFTATFNIDAGMMERPASLPTAVQAMLRPYCRTFFG